MTEAMLTDLPHYATSPAFSDLERHALRYTDAMCQTPADVSADLMAPLQARLTHAQLVELTAMIAWENYRSRFNRGFAVGSDGFSEGAVCAMPARPHPP